MGINVSTTNMYLSEISLIRLRGMLSIMNILNGACFVGISLFCAAVLPYNVLIQVAALPSCIFLIVATILLPESPIWYAKKGRFEDARKSLEWLRGSKYNLKEELEEMENILSRKENWKENIKGITERQSLFPILMMLIFMFLQVLLC